MSDANDESERTEAVGGGGGAQQRPARLWTFEIASSLGIGARLLPKAHSRFRAAFSVSFPSSHYTSDSPVPSRAPGMENESTQEWALVQRRHEVSLRTRYYEVFKFPLTCHTSCTSQSSHQDLRPRRAAQGMQNAPK